MQSFHMGILILIIIGAVFGWLATIILAIENTQRIILHAIVGAVGAVAAGFVIDGSTMGALSPLALFAGIGGSCLALVLYRYSQRTEIR